jgi:hypothetical protein
MARPRALSGAEGPKEPHAVSLKGLYAWIGDERPGARG